MKWLIALVCIAFGVSGVYAQSFVTPDALHINLNPQYPRPNSQLTLELESSSINTDAATIRWIVGGKIQQSQVGGRKFTTTVPAAGKKMTVTVEVLPPKGAVISKTITVVPNEVDIVWEALTYTPPLYLGRALPVRQADIRVQAIPNMFDANGVKINPDSLIYTWKVNGEGQQGGASGYGKSSFIYRAHVLEEPQQVEVTVRDREGIVTSYGSLLLEGGESQVVLYEQHPQLGILLNKALGSDAVSPYTGFVIAAVPYFTSVPSAFSTDLKYTWIVNNSTQDTNESSIALNYPENSRGYIPVQAKVQNNIRVFQRGDARSTIRVGGAEPIYQFEF